MQTKITLAVAIVLLSAAAFAGKAHLHGAAKLDVVIEGNRVLVNLDSPLDNIIGFEHLPRTTAEHKSVSEAKIRLSQATTMVQPNPEAQCKASSQMLESPVFEASGAKTTEHHLDIEAQYEFTCANPQELRQIQVGLFSAFPRLQKLQVQYAGPKGQKSLVLRPKQTKIVF